MSASRQENRRKSRARREHVAAAPFAVGIYLAENPNAAKLGARFSETYSARRAREVLAAAKLENAGPESVTFPGRDSRGRKNPRMPRRAFA